MADVDFMGVYPLARTSLTHPLYLDWLNLAAAPRFAKLPGRLGMTILPGKHQAGAMSGNHARDLELDAARLATEYGVTTFILLVEGWELEACRVPAFAATMARHGITVRHYPMVDSHTPADRSTHAPFRPSGTPPGTRYPGPGDVAGFGTLLGEIEMRLAAGETIAMSCRGGIGRTGLTAACLLVNGGLDPETAMRVTRASRKGTIENHRQETFVRRWQPPI